MPGPPGRQVTVPSDSGTGQHGTSSAWVYLQMPPLGIHWATSSLGKITALERPERRRAEAMKVWICIGDRAYMYSSRERGVRVEARKYISAHCLYIHFPLSTGVDIIRHRPALPSSSRRLQILPQARRRRVSYLSSPPPLLAAHSASPAEPAAVARDGRSTDANNIHGLTCLYKGRLVVPVQRTTNNSLRSW